MSYSISIYEKYFNRVMKEIEEYKQQIPLELDFFTPEQKEKIKEQLNALTLLSSELIDLQEKVATKEKRVLDRKSIVGSWPVGKWQIISAFNDKIREYIRRHQQWEKYIKFRIEEGKESVQKELLK